MTRDEILAMKPGRELDALIAEKVTKYVSLFGLLPPYSTEISAAWEVVEKMQGLREINGKPVRLQVRTITLKNRTMVTVQNYLDSFESVSETLEDSAPEAICKAALLSILEG